MRDVNQIKREMQSLKDEIRLSQREYTSQQELDVMYSYLDELEQELYTVQTCELSLTRVR
jgi:hypothetical protein